MADPEVFPADEAAITQRHWSEMARARQQAPYLQAELGWLDSPIVRERYIHSAISGQPGVSWLEWVMAGYVPRSAASICTLGCGAGGLERHARVLGCQAAFDSFDVSAGALAVAREEAVRLGLAGITYQQADLNSLRSLPNDYEVVFGCMSLHHVLNLEQLFQAVHEALVPGGRLIFNEFIGPRKFQWTDLQLEIINRVLAALPPRLREDRTQPGTAKEPVKRPTVEEMDRIDPSEAALSDRIMPLAHQVFEPVVIREYGGTILHLLLDRIMGNFREDAEADREILLDVFQLEALLLKTKVLPSDFAVAVFEKP
jgi:SAM-dependent methyltransferase